MTELYMNNEDISTLSYRVLSIIRGTTVDGPGFRTSIYLSGCSHNCQGCHNPQSWDPEAGIPMSLKEILDIVKEEDFDVTLTGGDPLFNPGKTKILINELKKNRRNVWIYTGFYWEEIISSEILISAIKNADVVVEGRFIESLRNLDLPFRGSSNQRIINIPLSLQKGYPVLY